MDKDVFYIYIYTQWSISHKNEILPVELEGIMLSETSQTEKNKYSYDFTYMWNLKDKTNEQT